MSSNQKSPYRVVVIDSGVPPNRTDLLIAELARFTSEREFEVVYLPRKFFHDDGAHTNWQRIGNAFKNVVWMNLVLISAARADAVHVGPMSSRVLWFVLKLKRLFRIKVIYDVYASVVLTDDETVQFGGYVADRSRRQKRESDSLRGCDLLIFLQSAEYEAVCDRLQLEFDPDGVRIVPLASEEPNLSANVGERGDDESLNMVWWGCFSPLHGVDVVLDAMRQLKQDPSVASRIRLTIYGKGTTRIDLSAAVESRDLRELVTLDFEKSFASGDLTRALAHADLSLGQFGASLKSRVVVPNKAVESFAHALPLLTARNDAYLEFMDEETAYFVDADSHAIAEKIQRILSEPEDRVTRAARGQAVFRKEFSVQNYRLAMRSIYRELRHQRDVDSHSS